jgi:hypothetical protein
MTYVKPVRLILRTHPEFTEHWVQERIAEDPTILGLGDLVLKDKERIHPQAGRLDILCQDADATRRYEIEIQLGRTDESHIIRTIEYWDIERKRYPQYDHVAVIVAEEITGRFLNVISLFNGFIPIVAIQMQAFQIENVVTLVFSTVLSELRLGLVDDDEVPEVTDRGYWEGRSKQSLEVTDAVFALLRQVAPELSLKYNKYYIGLARNGQPNNFVYFNPKKDWVRVNVRLERSDEVQARLEQAGLDLMDYDSRGGYYRFRLSKGDVQQHRDVLLDLFRLSLGEVGA